MPQQIGWSVEAKLLYEIKQLTRQLSGRQYILTFPNFASFPTPGITGTLYVDESTGDIYVWNGAAYTLLSAGITALNGLIAAAQLLTTGSTGTDFNISSVGTTHTFNIPTASATNRGLLSSANWTTFNNKQNAITLTTTGTSGAATLVGSTLNIPQYQSVLTNPVTGTGTTNYIPKFTAASTIGNSIIFDNATNVGIGTTSPSAKLHVQGAEIRIQDDNSNINFRNTAGTRTGYIQSRVDAFDIWNDQAVPIVIGTNNTERLRITSGGAMYFKGASTTTDAQADIENDNTALYLFGSLSGSVNKEIRMYFNGTSSGERFRMFNNGRVFIGASPTDAGYQLDINGTLRSVNGANFATTSGNVGIGTASPSTKLEVSGTGRFTNTQADFEINATSTSQFSRLRFLENGTGKGTIQYLNSAFSVASRQNYLEIINSGGLNIFTANNFSTPDMSLLPSGEVLISTTTDAGDYKLQVVGNQYLSGKLVVGTTTDSGQTVQINSSLRLIPTSTVPTASAGTLYYDTATNKLKLYDGTSWVDLN